MKHFKPGNGSLRWLLGGLSVLATLVFLGAFNSKDKITALSAEVQETGANKIEPKSTTNRALDNKIKATERMIGYQVGVRHLMDRESCPNPKIRSYALTDALLSRFTAPEALTRIYSEAIWWVRRYCNLSNGQTAKMDIELIVDNETVASIILEDRKIDPYGKRLWWAKRLRVTDSRIGSKKEFDGVIPNYLQLVSNTLLEKDRPQREKFAQQLIDFNLKDLDKVNDPVIAFELARMKSSKIKGNIKDMTYGNGTLYFEEQGSQECPEDKTLLQRAADLGSAPAAFLMARCGVNLELLWMGKDLARIVRKQKNTPPGVDPYDRFMFYITKSRMAGYAPAFGLMESATGYDDEIKRYVKLISPHGLTYPFSQYSKSNTKANKKEFISPPSKAELMSKLNHDILMNNCSKLKIFLGSKSNPATFALSSIEGVDGWCVTSNFGAKIKIRVGKVTDSTCDKKGNNQFTCKIKYRLGCEIESFKSTTKGNQLICSTLTLVSIPGDVEASRGKDDLLTVNTFRAGGNKHWLHNR